MITYFTNFIYFLQKIYNAVVSVFIRYNYDKKTNPSLSKETIIQYNKQRNKGPKKKICFAPFKHMYFKSDGTITPCCRNEKDMYGTIGKGTLTELFHSKSIESVRNKIEDYNLCDGCNYCNIQLQSSNFNAFEGRLYDSILPGKAGNFPTEMTFEISNQCNLECIMCDGNYSSSIRKNREKLPELENKYDDAFSETIKEGIPYLKVARFLGGEPFLIPQYIDIIDNIIKENKNCRIYIQTNGTILNNRVKKIIEHKNVHLSISIDSLQKEMYEKIRKNASFVRLMEHMDYFIERSKKHKQIININYCVMTNNWMEVPEMIQFCNTNNFSLSLIPVEFPRYLSLRSWNVNKLNEIVSHYSKPEYNNLFSSNKFNGEKLTNLISYIRFCIENNNKQNQRISYLQSIEIDLLEKILNEHFLKIKLKENEIATINDHIKKVIVNLNNEEKKTLYITFINDLEQHSNETPIYHFKNTIEWQTLFKAYLENLVFCDDKSVYL
jgi:MoaA/NifB/PqqE/SkfB family radical SAM enzyme